MNIIHIITPTEKYNAYEYIFWGGKGIEGGPLFNTSKFRSLFLNINTYQRILADRFAPRKSHRASVASSTDLHHIIYSDLFVATKTVAHDKVYCISLGR